MEGSRKNVRQPEALRNDPGNEEPGDQREDDHQTTDGHSIGKSGPEPGMVLDPIGKSSQHDGEQTTREGQDDQPPGEAYEEEGEANGDEPNGPALKLPEAAG